VRLAQSLLHQHKTAEGETLLKSIIATSTDPLQLNDAAYELANNSLDLPLAEAASRRSLDLLDQASNQGETGPNSLIRARLITSAWDTYGWILYRSGKIDAAEPWIRAAWRNGFSAECGYHLGILLEKQNRLAEASDQFKLASQGESGPDAQAVRKLISDESAALLKSLPADNSTPPSKPTQSVPATYTKDGHVYSLPKYLLHPITDAEFSLQNQRTYQLSRGALQPTGEGWATIELDITTQGTVAFRIVSGDQSLQPLADTVQHLSLDLQIPPVSHATLLRRGVLSCSASGPNCQLVLISTSAAPNS
jgi:hypothetical protein